MIEVVTSIYKLDQRRKMSWMVLTHRTEQADSRHKEIKAQDKRRLPSSRRGGEESCCAQFPKCTGEKSYLLLISCWLCEELYYNLKMKWSPSNTHWLCPFSGTLHAFVLCDFNHWNVRILSNRCVLNEYVRTINAILLHCNLSFCFVTLSLNGAFTREHMLYFCDFALSLLLRK